MNKNYNNNNNNKTKGVKVSQITLSSDKEQPLNGDLRKKDFMETIPIEAFNEEESKNEINQDEEATSEKGKKKKRKDNISKSDCSKPKYSAKHPEECGSVESKQVNAVLVKKCKKEKYRKKHDKRCLDLKSFTHNMVDVDKNVEGRCSKAKYRAHHPEACDNVKQFFLEDRCKHKNFQLKNVNICCDVCPQKSG